MPALRFPKEFIDRLTTAAEDEGKTVEAFIVDAVNAYKAREKAKEKGEPVPPGTETKRRRSGRNPD
jgi:hypothetical protein